MQSWRVVGPERNLVRNTQSVSWLWRPSTEPATEGEINVGPPQPVGWNMPASVNSVVELARWTDLGNGRPKTRSHD